MSKDYVWNPATCSRKNGKYVRSTTPNSVITCDKIIDMTKCTSRKTVPAKCTSIDFFILPTFYELP